MGVIDEMKGSWHDPCRGRINALLLTSKLLTRMIFKLAWIYQQALVRGPQAGHCLANGTRKGILASLSNLGG
jgi:hypothetical protein